MAEIIDTRELHDYLAELEERQQAAAQADQTRHEDEELAPLNEDEQLDLAELQAMRDGIEDWQFGETLIPEDEFIDYVRQLAEDVGDINSEQSSRWPYNHIDWPAAADDLREDYTEYTYGGVTYLAR
jgi:hypothetical protein